MSRHRLPRFVLLVVAAGGLTACTTYRTGVENEPSPRHSRYAPIDQPTPGSGSTGIESQDIVAMTDLIMRDMLANQALLRPDKPAVVVMDAEYFVNDSSQRLNKRLIVDRLRNELFRAANGKMRFIARHQGEMVQDEQAQRRTGDVAGTPQRTMPTADYRLGGRFQDLPGGNDRGVRDNYVQILFEMIDLNNGELVYSGMYEFKKTATESIWYQ